MVVDYPDWEKQPKASVRMPQALSMTYLKNASQTTWWNSLQVVDMYKNE
jgi:hypothetical protein